MCVTSRTEQSRQSKSHGVFNHARCRLKGWELSEVDALRVARSDAAEIVLLQLPKKLFVEMVDPHVPRYEHLPERWVPLPPVLVTWTLRDEAGVRLLPFL